VALIMCGKSPFPHVGCAAAGIRAARSCSSEDQLAVT